MRVFGIALLVLLVPACGGDDEGKGESGDDGGGGRGGSGGTGSDRRPVLRFADDTQIAGEGDRVEVVLVMDPPSSEAVTGDLTVEGTATFPDDHDFEPTSFSFEPNQESLSIDFDVVDDLEVEPDEELT